MNSSDGIELEYCGRYVWDCVDDDVDGGATESSMSCAQPTVDPQTASSME